MTCEEFREILPDHIDQALEAGRAAAAAQHVAQCSGCRLALEREQALGRSLRQTLDRATASVSVSPDLARRIVHAAQESAPPRPALATAWRWCAANPFRTAGLATALLVGLVLVPQFRRSRTAEPVRRAGTAGLSDGYVVDVPVRVETHVFRMQNGTIVDVVLTEVSVSRAYFPSPPDPSRSKS